MTQLPLAGRRIAITADRKGAELAASLKRLGAEVVWGTTMTAVPPERDSILPSETEQLLANEPTWIAISTGSGMKAWLEAANAFGRRDDIEALLRSTPVVARGAKSHGALRAIGVEPVFVSKKETMDDVCSWLSERLEPHDVLAAQVHGGEVIGTLDALRPKISQVLTVAPYRWVLPDDIRPAQRLIQEIVESRIDILVETSAPSVRNLVAIAAGMGAKSALLTALRGDLCVASVGSVTARAFEEVGVGVDVMPTRPRTADLLRSIAQWVARQPAAEAPTDSEVSAGLELIPDALAVRIGPTVIRLGPQEFAVLAAMVRRPGVALRSEALAVQAWGHKATADTALVRHQVARVRRKLGRYGPCLQTVRNVGYRYDPSGLIDPDEG
jgi:uroporphyrinogen-III synthase